MPAIRVIDSHLELADIGLNTHAQIEGHIQGIGNYTFPAADGLSSQVLQTDGVGVLSWVDRFGCTDLAGCSLTNLGTRSHYDLTGIGANNHHNELHTIVSHSDTSATGAQLDTLTDNSIANALHRHSELVASDGSPDPALSVGATGKVGIGTPTPDRSLHLKGTEAVQMKQESSNSTGTIFDFVNTNAGVNTWCGTRAWSAAVNKGAFGVELNNRRFAVGPATIAPVDQVFWVNVVSGDVFIQGKVGIGIASPATSALLDLTSTTGALLLTRMTTAQKNALTAVNGMVLYDSTLNKFQGYENGAWTSLI